MWACDPACREAMCRLSCVVRLCRLLILAAAIAWPLILLGLLFNSNSSALFLNLGVLAFSASVLFQVVTLPVEFNASGRALRILGDTGMLYPDEVRQTRKVLTAAALTYVAGAAAAILQLLAYPSADRFQKERLEK